MALTPSTLYAIDHCLREVEQGQDQLAVRGHLGDIIKELGGQSYVAFGSDHINILLYLQLLVIKQMG